MVQADYEVFHELHIPGPIGKRKSISERDRDPIQFLEFAEAFNLSQKPSMRHYGFKIFFGQNDPVLETLIADPEWQVIVLERRNRLDQYISLKIAEETNIWSSPEGNVSRRITVNEQAFIKFCAYVDGLYHDVRERLDAANQRYLNLFYNDIAASNYASLCSFLGLAQPHNLLPTFQKQNPVRTAEKLVNPDDALAFLKSRNLSHWWVE